MRRSHKKSKYGDTRLYESNFKNQGGRSGMASQEHSHAMPSRYKVGGGVQRSMSISVPLLIKRRNLIESYRVGRGVYM